MSKILMTAILITATVFLLPSCNSGQLPEKGKILLKDVTLIDGSGGNPQEHKDILLQGDSISEIGSNLDTTGLQVINLAGKTVMPALISVHVHVGLLKGTQNKAGYYTRENILAQLKKYEDYGVGNILVMGSDRPLLFSTGLRDSSQAGLLSGTRLHSAAYGFGVPAGAPPVEMGMDRVYRPSKISQIPMEMDSLVALKPDVVKLWLDDFGGKFTKMTPDIYKTIIDESHKRNLRVAAHVYYLADARRLVADGVDIIGHSIRDSVMDDALVQQIKSKGIVYIPTLSLDEFSYIYARRPEWVNDPFFKASLEPGVYEIITSEKYQDSLKKSPAYTKNAMAFEIALQNLKKLYDAGVLVALGTDSGAMFLRAQGFSEHLELELLVQAGLTPLQAITIGTKNAAKALKVDKKFGTIEKGKTADLLIMDDNPLTDIKNTRKIYAVYKSGKEVSKGPLKNK